MRNRIIFWILVSTAAFMPGDSSGLIIYRFGGESLPPPPEVGGQDVTFIQLKWSDLDGSQGGETIRLDMDDQLISALRHDPQANIVTGFQERGGGVVQSTRKPMFDGDTSTVGFIDSYIQAQFRAANYYIRCYDGFCSPGTINLELGDVFLLDRIRIISGLFTPGSVARDFRIYISAEIPVKTSVQPPPYNPFLLEIRDNREQVLDIEIPPFEQVSFVQVAMGEHRQAWEIAEIEIYAKGFVDKSSYVSNVLDFGALAAWGDIRWSGKRDRGAEVFVQTRSGLNREPNVYWTYSGRGDEKVAVSKSQYSNLGYGEKAGTSHDRENWTFWSAPYDFADSSGTAVVSLSPRSFFQFRVDFIPQGSSGGELGFVEFRASVPPAASEVVGEISPIEAQVGEISRFTYVLKPTIQGEDTGFDRLEVSSSSIMNAVNSVRIGDVDVSFVREAMDENRFEVSFPKVEQQDSGTLVEVVFDAQVLRFGSSFNGRVFDSSRPLEVHQVVNPGDATPDFEGNTVSVATVGEERLLMVSVRPAAFTPNGDGVNDVAEISYDIFEVTGSVSAIAEIWDLSGRLVRGVYSGEDPIGHYSRLWDGRDDSGEVVPPGVYLHRVSVDTDEKKAVEVGIINVAY